MNETNDIPAHRHEVKLRSGAGVVIEDDEVVGTVVNALPLAGEGEAVQLPGAVDGDGKPLPPVRRNKPET